MITSDYKPILKRYVEILPVRHNGEEFVLLRDTEGISEKTVLVSPESMILIQFFNGQNSVRDIQSAILKLTGHLVSEADIIDFVKKLDDADLLENEKIVQMRKMIYEEFRKSPIRKAIHKGLSYPDNILELTSFMSKFLKISDNFFPTSFVKGLIVPHIDLIRGGRLYGIGYGELLKSKIPDLVIAFGVSHKGGNSPFIFTSKDFETPYGNMETDKEVFGMFKDILWYDPYDEEYLHKNEHSLEFQSLWLKYIWREKAPKWLGILVSDFERFAYDKPPSSIEYIEKFFNESKKILEKIKNTKRVIIICGADFSHVGLRFGDDVQITPTLKSEVERYDKEIISSITDLKADEFYMKVVSNGNKTNICGLSAVYSALRFIEFIDSNAKGKLLDYALADDPFGGFVSFASIVF